MGPFRAVGRDFRRRLCRSQFLRLGPYRSKNEWEFIDPIGIYDEILKLEADIDGFKTNIDSQLVLSNATSFIEVNF